MILGRLTGKSVVSSRCQACWISSNVDYRYHHGQLNCCSWTTSLQPANAFYSLLQACLYSRELIIQLSVYSPHSILLAENRDKMEQVVQEGRKTDKKEGEKRKKREKRATLLVQQSSSWRGPQCKKRDYVALSLHTVFRLSPR